jgi:mono/diheme cytochrome c family protein
MNIIMQKDIFKTIFVLFSLSAFISSAFAEDTGYDLYDEFCQRCHGDDKEGVSNYKGDLADFIDRLNGNTQNMPDFTDFFDDDEVVSLYEYLNQTE